MVSKKSEFLSKIRLLLKKYPFKIMGSIVLVLALLGLFRYDFFFTLDHYKVRPNDSLWSILSNKVLYSPTITRRSIEYLNGYAPTFDLGHLEANTDVSLQNGDVINIENGIMTIKNSAREYIFGPRYILPPENLHHHFAQVIFYDVFLLVTFACLMYMVIREDTKFLWYSLKVFAGAFVVSPGILIFIVILLLLTLGPIRPFLHLLIS